MGYCLQLKNNWGLIYDHRQYLQRHINKLVSSTAVHAGMSLKQRNRLKFKTVKNIKL
jgi:hypothetical protein